MTNEDKEPQDPFALAAEEDAVLADIEPDDDETKVMELIPGGLDRAGSTRNPGLSLSEPGGDD